jgi:hypothetical protein
MLMKRIILIAFLLLVPVAMALQKSRKPDPVDSPDEGRWEYLALAGPTTTNFSSTSDSISRKEGGTFAREALVLEQHLDRLGARGWELVTVAGPPTDPVYYFKRRK